MLLNRSLLAVAVLGLAPLAHSQGSLEWVLKAALIPADLNEQALFGTAVEVDAGLLVIGANGKENGGSGPDGAVYTWRRTATGWWEPLPLLVPPVAGLSGNFGRGLALSGDRLLVGAPLEDAPTVSSSGAAYLYELDASGTAWQLAASFTPVQPEQGANFGFTVSLDGDRCAVMARSNGPVTASPLQLYVRESSGAWVADGLIQKPPTIGFAGWNASLSGDRIAVPDETGSGSAPSSGIVRIFRREATGWQLEATLAPGGVPNFGTFGRSVSFDGNRLAVGRGSHLTLGPAYLFSHDTAGNWTLDQTIVPSDPVTGLGFGFSIELDGDRLVVGAFNIGIAPHPGSAHVYALEAGSWQLQAILEGDASPPVVALDGVARDVAIDATSVVVGAGQSAIQVSPFSVQDRGAAFVYETIGSQPLEGHPVHLSLTSGGVQQLELDFGASAAGQLYIVVGSLSGTAPGVPVDGLLIPLVPDSYTNMTLAAPNVPPLGATFAALDGAGRALATFSIPPGAPPSVAGLVVHHAAVVLDTSGPVSVAAVSGPVPLHFAQ